MHTNTDWQLLCHCQALVTVNVHASFFFFKLTVILRFNPFDAFLSTIYYNCTFFRPVPLNYLFVKPLIYHFFYLFYFKQMFFILIDNDA